MILTFEGNVKIIDFGIAKAADNLARTQLGVFKGKVAYASPEQCHCERVDRRSDVFSLGVLLFELSTGRVPFPQDNELAVMKAITEETIPRPSEIDPTYPPALERIVLRAMARKRSERYATARDLQQDLECFAREHRLDLSPFSLVRLLERLFRDEIDAWQMAREAGITLDQHVVRSRIMGRGQAAREPDREGGADGSPGRDAVDLAVRTRSAAADLATTAPARSPSSPPPTRQKARRQRWIVMGLATGLLAAGMAFGASRSFSPGPTPSPKASTTAAADEILRNAEGYRAGFERARDEPPCLPPTCATASAFNPCGAALYYYRLYLKVSPEAVNRVEVEAVIKDLEGQCK